jgi:SAM-dependent methyltransferase
MPLARLEFDHGGIRDVTSAPSAILEPFEASILEIFCHEQDVETAYRKYCELLPLLSVSTEIPLHSLHNVSARIGVVLVGRKVLVCRPELIAETYRLANLWNKRSYVPELPSEQDLSHAMRVQGIEDLSNVSSEKPVVSSNFSTSLKLKLTKYPEMTRNAFNSHVSSLSKRGLLTPASHQIAMGDMRRSIPFCPSYGYSRGTPIDRYYLARFVDKVRPLVIGRALEIGGRKGNHRLYGFTETSDYLTMDLEHDEHSDIVGDAQNANEKYNSTFDSIVLFNVLEHCEKPWLVARNAHAWLKPGGRLFALVPTVQRLHRDPMDYWRLMPDAMQSILGDFENVEVSTFGNLLTVNAALYGIAAEELRDYELNDINPEYPVVTCAVAYKSDF